MTPVADVAAVLDLYARFGDETYGEDVTQTAHALQCAALAEAERAADALVAAALLHDIGHLVHLADGGRDADALGVDDDHESVGSRALAPLFGPEVTAPIALHVTAKRYRCTVEPGYAEALSAASVRSLALQGGPLDDATAGRFARLPGADAAIRLRGWDDTGKVAGLAVPDLAHFHPLLTRLAR